MNQDSTQWDTSRWRNSNNGSLQLLDSVQGHSGLRGPRPMQYPSRQPPPQLSAPTAVNPTAPQSAILARQQSTDAWIRKSRESEPLRGRGLITEPYSTTAEESNCQTRLYHDRHSPKSGPHELANASSSDEATFGTWRLHHPDRRTSLSHPSDAPPLTLHIPQAQDLPRSSNIKLSRAERLQPYVQSNYPASATSTSLPSFASLREHTTRPEDADGPEIAPMSSRLSCYLCTKLKPLVQDVTAAVADLEGTVQAFCGGSSAGTRTTDVPNDSPVRAVQWILERLHYAKHDLQHESTRRTQSGYQALDAPSQNTSPHNSLKRPTENWDRDDNGLKRPRSGASIDQPYHQSTFMLRDSRRESIGFSHREHVQGISPPSESVPGSAYPRQTSPTVTTRLNTRALPSPSSLAYPPSAAPSLPPTAQSAGSPAPSYQQASSVHTSSTGSATSAHIADLQHQITLKSLALQTLQSEYESLLQKLQRERVKSQAIEKKTSVADQEVNELTTKNEELTEQVKLLETQLEDVESKREAERAEAAKEKDQWGRMLEMGGRLQAKIEGERQKLLEEKARLTQRVNCLEDPNGSRAVEVEARNQPQHTAKLVSEQGLNNASSTQGSTGQTAQREHETINGEVVSLKQQIASLNGRVSSLRLALEGAKHQNAELEEYGRRFLERSSNLGNSVDRTIQEDDTIAKQADLVVQRSASSRSTPARLQPAWTPPSSSLPPPPPPVHAKQPPGPRLDTFQVYSDGKVTTARIAEVARAKSPGPEELGVHVKPTNLTPDELIQQLGPVPAPIPALQFAARNHQWSPFKDQRPKADLPTSGCLHHVPTLRTVQTDQERPVGSSPRSYHSSPGELMEDRSSNASSANRSPEAYASDPEGKSSVAAAKPNPSYARFHPIQMENPAANDSGPQYHSSHYTRVPAMPPPPRPEPTSSFTS